MAQTHADLIEAIQRWQAEPLVQTLVCAGACKGKLEPIERQGRVVLVCRNCGARETYIPEIVARFTGLSDATRKFLGS